jgi:hypothetical protein
LSKRKQTNKLYHFILVNNNNTSTKKQIVADINEQPKTIFQKQLSVQDTIQKHFSEILKNESITVRDDTFITETLMMKENTNPSRKYRVNRSKFMTTVGVCTRIVIHHFTR